MEQGRPAGFWIRAVALGLDFVVLFLVELSLGAVAGLVGGSEVESSLGLAPMVWIFTMIFAGLYTSTMHSISGQTVGKMLLRVRVVDLDGRPPGFGAALLRHIAYFISLGIFGLGYLMAALRQDKRALHDLIASTRVEHVSRPAPPPVVVEPSREPVATAEEPSSAGYL